MLDSNTKYCSQLRRNHDIDWMLAPTMTMDADLFSLFVFPASMFDFIRPASQKDDGKFDMSDYL